jgi:menaquinone-9 beta-reductase
VPASVARARDATAAVRPGACQIDNAATRAPEAWREKSVESAPPLIGPWAPIRQGGFMSRNEDTTFDAVIVGASLAGATAATLLGRAGLRVALLERSRREDAHKQVCTHAIQAHATPVLERLGLIEPLRRAGAVPMDAELWTRFGPVHHPGPRRHGWQVRRSTLDPLLRTCARSTPGVTWLPGCLATGLIRDPARGDRVVGVEARSAGGTLRLRAPLVIGADGRHSRVAELLGAPTRVVDNERCTYFAYFEGVSFPRPGCGQLWLLEPEVAYAFPTDGDLAILTVSPPRADLPVFRADLDRAFRSVLSRCPGAEHLAAARRVSEYRGMIDIPNVSRPPVRDGVALIGDAALASDPIWGTGCGFALVTAAWLADTVADPLLALRATPSPTTVPLDRALARYARRHRKELTPHQDMIESHSRIRPLGLLERLMFHAGAEDPVVAAAIDRVGGRLASPESLIRPDLLARMVWVKLRAALRRRPPAAGVPHATPAGSSRSIA